MAHFNNLVALRAVSNGALQLENLPTRIKVLDWGKNDSLKGPIMVDSVTKARLPGNQLQFGHDKVALDFEHNTVPGSPEYDRTQGPRAVAAYGTPEVIEGQGIFLKDLQWTPAGQREARNYHDLSPAAQLDETGRVIFLHSVALVRNGAVAGLSFYSARPLLPGSIVTLAAYDSMVEPIDVDVYTALVWGSLQGLLEMPGASKDQIVARLRQMAQCVACFSANPNAARGGIILLGLLGAALLGRWAKKPLTAYDAAISQRETVNVGDVAEILGLPRGRDATPGDCWKFIQGKLGVGNAGVMDYQQLGLLFRIPDPISRARVEQGVRELNWHALATLSADAPTATNQWRGRITTFGVRLAIDPGPGQNALDRFHWAAMPKGGRYGLRRAIMAAELERLNSVGNYM